MNRTLTTMMIGALSLFCHAQRKVYDAQGGKQDVISETPRITFHGPIATFESDTNRQQYESAILATVLTTLADAGFSYLDSVLKQRVLAYTSEFSAHQIYAEQTGYSVPSFTVERVIEADGKSPFILKLTFEAVALPPKDLRACFFRLKSFELSGARAKVKKKSGDRLDYTVEIKPVFVTVQDGEHKKTVVELKPLQIHSAPWDGKGIPERALCSDLMLIPPNAAVVELDVKVTETNPRRVKAQWVLDQWTKHREKIKGFVNDKMPSAELKVTMPPVATGKPNAVVSNDTK